MSGFGLLLDSGVMLRISALTIDDARAVLKQRNDAHRDGMAERERCNASGDYLNFPLVIPTLAVALIKPKSRAASLSPFLPGDVARKAPKARRAS